MTTTLYKNNPMGQIFNGVNGLMLTKNLAIWLPCIQCMVSRFILAILINALIGFYRISLTYKWIIIF